MKTKILFLFAIIMMMFVACSEDIYLHDGADGTNGKNGYSIVTKVDPVYSASDKNVLVGQTTSFYQDVDNDGKYSSSDVFQNSITILNGTNGINGLDASIKTTLLAPSNEAPMGSILFESYTGTTKTGSITFALPKNGIDGINGQNGKDGQNGYSPLMSVKEVKLDGKVIGNETSFYLDLNRNEKVDLTDSFLGGFVIWNGTNGTNGSNGSNGINGKTPDITFQTVDGYLVIKSSVDGVTVSSTKFTIPKDGQNGLNGQNGQDGQNGYSPVMEVKEVKLDGKVVGTETSFFLDLNRNGKVDLTDSYLEGFVVWNGTNGANGTNGSNGANGTNGVDGKTPDINFQIIDGYLVIKSSIDGVTMNSIKFAIPKDGQNGQNGQNGQDGQNGYSPVVEIKKVTNQAGVVIGNETSFYLDLNRNGIVDISSDSYAGGFIIWNGTDGIDGVNGTNGSNGINGINGIDGKTPKINFEVSNGYLIISSSVDGVTVSSTKFTIPKDGQNGLNGQNGQNGYSPVMTIAPYYDECNELVGNKLKFWLDLDRNGAYSSGDSFMNSIIVLNGVKGKDGVTKTCSVNFDIVESKECSSGKSINFTSSIDSTIVDSASFCIPKDGKDGDDDKDHLCLKKTKNNDGSEKDEWYWDNDGNGKYDEGKDIKLGECHR